MSHNAKLPSRQTPMPGPQQADDAALMARVRLGGEDAFQAVVNRYWPQAHAYALSFSVDADSAEDLVQESLIELWERRDSWVGRGSVRGFLFRVIRNRVLNARRHQRIRWKISRAQSARSTAGQVTPAQILDGREAEALAEGAIQSLPERRREVFRLVRIQQLSYREVAEVMDISVQTVANQMSAALKELRSALSDYL